MKRVLSIFQYSLLLFLFACGGGNRYSTHDVTDYDYSEYDSSYEETVDNSEVEELEQRVAELEQAKEELEQYKDEMEQHVQDLRYKSKQVDYQLDRFQTDSWREVVPQVIESQYELNREFNNEPLEPSY